MIDLERRTDDKNFLLSRFTVVDPSHPGGGDVTTKHLTQQRPKGDALEVMVQTVLAVFAAKDACEETRLMHPVAGAPGIGNRFVPSHSVRAIAFAGTYQCSVDNFFTGVPVFLGTIVAHELIPHGREPKRKGSSHKEFVGGRPVAGRVSDGVVCHSLYTLLVVRVGLGSSALLAALLMDFKGASAIIGTREVVNGREGIPPGEAKGTTRNQLKVEAGDSHFLHLQQEGLPSGDGFVGSSYHTGLAVVIDSNKWLSSYIVEVEEHFFLPGVGWEMENMVQD